MSGKPTRFADIFAEEDTLGLLTDKPTGPSRSSEDEIILDQFKAINDFVDLHGFNPGNTEKGRDPSLQEYALEASLEALRAVEAYCKLLGPLDKHGLLGLARAAAIPTTLDEILASEDPLLSSPADDIFKLTHVSDPARKKATLDEIAKRRPCPDFERFSPLFNEMRQDLKAGRRYTKRFEREGSIVPGAAFILNGIIAYVTAVDEIERRGKEHDARIRVIFDNGMESNHLLRSFARVLYEDDNGRQIVESAPSISGPLFGGQGHITGPLFTSEPAEAAEFGEIKGTVYIVESCSEDPNIVALKGRLYKIGFTTQLVEKRLADVEKDPTFLFSKVKLRATYETNFNPRKLEKLLHQFFAHAKLQVEVVLGRPVIPKEWFVVPLDLVEQAVKRILDRSITQYRYDAVSRKILPR